MDADAGENGHVIYALEPDASRSTSLFRVDPGTGSVRLAGELLPASDVTNATYHVTVIARDAGRPVRSAALRLSVMVRSTSEHAGCVTSLCGGAENTSTGKRKYGKGKYETANFARMENACTEYASTENASTMQTFSQIKKVWYFTS